MAKYPDLRLRVEAFLEKLKVLLDPQPLFNSEQLAPLGDGNAGLQEYLSANLYMPVEPLNLEAVLDISKVPALEQPAQQQRYFMALGAALRHEVKVL